MKRTYESAILLAGLFWGMIGLFTRNLGGLGVGSEGVLLLRSGGCCVLFGLLMLWKEPEKFRIRLRDLWLFLCFGILATFFFTFSYYRAIELADMSVACTLMYTAPVFVMVMSLFVFKESFSGRKLLALLMAVGGCALVSGILSGGSVSSRGLMFGLMAGIGYALYSIFSKLLSGRGYDVFQINFYGWLFCSATGLLVWGFQPALPGLDNLRGLLFSGGLIVISGFLPSLLYNWALGGVEASKASMMVSIEPVVAGLVGVLFFGEALSLPALLGMALVLGAVLLLNTKEKNGG